MNRSLLLTAITALSGAALVGCGSGDINIEPQTNVTDSNNTTNRKSAQELQTPGKFFRDRGCNRSCAKVHDAVCECQSHFAISKLPTSLVYVAAGKALGTARRREVGEACLVSH